MCVPACLCVCARACVCMHVCTCMCIHVCVRVCTCVCVHMFIHVCVQACGHSPANGLKSLCSKKEYTDHENQKGGDNFLIIKCRIISSNLTWGYVDEAIHW